MDDRYTRNMPALTEAEGALIREKSVCIVGCGGLGGTIIELLARVGVGALTVVDGDVFDVTNLNRQLLSDETLLGTRKAAAAKARVAKINSDVSVTPVAEFFTEENGPKLLEGCDLVIDALDSAAGRRMLASVCAQKGLTIVHGAISGWCAQVTVVAPGSGVFDRLYPPGVKEVLKKGSPAFTPAVCAAMQATEAIKLLCGRPPALLGKLLLMDLRAMEFTKIDI